MATITKKDLVELISEETDQTQVITKRIIQRFLDAIVEELAAGNRLEFREFGVFETRVRQSRRARNPRTGEDVPVEAKTVVSFKAGRLMRERVLRAGTDRMRREAARREAGAAPTTPSDQGTPSAQGTPSDQATPSDRGTPSHRASTTTQPGAAPGQPSGSSAKRPAGGASPEDPNAPTRPSG